MEILHFLTQFGQLQSNAAVSGYVTKILARVPPVHPSSFPQLPLGCLTGQLCCSAPSSLHFVRMVHLALEGEYCFVNSGIIKSLFLIASSFIDCVIASEACLVLQLFCQEKHG